MPARLSRPRPGTRQILSESPLHLLTLESRGADTWELTHFRRPDAREPWRADVIVLDGKTIRRIAGLVK